MPDIFLTAIMIGSGVIAFVLSLEAMTSNLGETGKKWLCYMFPIFILSSIWMAVGHSGKDYTIERYEPVDVYLPAETQQMVVVGTKSFNVSESIHIDGYCNGSIHYIVYDDWRAGVYRVMTSNHFKCVPNDF